jgi:hypothetical protein
MWKVDPTKMCRKHLLGEHVEMHMFVGSINKGINIEGYIRTGLVDVSDISSRHDCLADEMRQRGYKHNKELPLIDLVKLIQLTKTLGKVDVTANEIELHRRCKECKF